MPQIASTGYGGIVVQGANKVFEKRSTHADPDPSAHGTPHTVIEEPGPEGKYTTFNPDGSVKHYRVSGKPHWNVPRPNVKETKINPSPTGPRPGKPEEMPKG